jgi:hypothetical protein
MRQKYSCFSRTASAKPIPRLCFDQQVSTQSTHIFALRRLNKTTFRKTHRATATATQMGFSSGPIYLWTERGSPDIPTKDMTDQFSPTAASLRLFPRTTFKSMFHSSSRPLRLDAIHRGKKWSNYINYTPITERCKQILTTQLQTLIAPHQSFPLFTTMGLLDPCLLPSMLTGFRYWPIRQNAAIWTPHRGTFACEDL